MATDLTTECKQGYEAPSGSRAPFLYSSPAWLAFMAGQNVRGMSGIKRCRMGRGYTVNVETAGGNKVVVSFAKNDLTTVTVNRL
jgi:hypothetical protein